MKMLSTHRKLGLVAIGVTLAVTACSASSDPQRSAGAADGTDVILASAQESGQTTDAVQEYQETLAQRAEARVKRKALASLSKQLLQDSAADPSVRALLQTGSCTNCSFKGLDLTGLEFGKVDVSGSDFSGATIYNTSFGAGSNFSRTVFDLYSDRPAQVAGVVAKNGNWTGARFNRTQLYDSDITGANLSGVTFADVVLDPTLTMNKLSWSPGRLTVKDSVVAYPGFVRGADIQPDVDPESQVRGTWGDQAFDNVSFLVEPANRAYLKETTAPNVAITKSRFLGSRPDFFKVKFTGTTSLSGSNFSGLQLENANLSSADLRETNFRNSSLLEANLSGVNAHRADFTNARLGNVNLTQAQLGRGASGTDGSADLTAVDARGADFSGSDLRGTSLRGAYLFLTKNQPKFANAEMADVRLDQAMIANADFSYAKLDRASLRGAQCINCKFTNAKVTNADFARAYLFGSDFDSAVLDRTEFPDAAYQGPAGTWRFNSGIDSAPAPVSYPASKGMGAKAFVTVADCPDRSTPSGTTGCAGKEMPRSAPPIPPSCQEAGNYLCQAVVTTILGQPGSEAGAGPAVPLTAPSRVVAYQRDGMSSGIVLVADTGRHVVRQVDLSAGGRSSIVAGIEDQPGFQGDRGPADKAALNRPTGLAVDPQGRIYIADTGNNRIRRIETDGTIVTLAGTGEAGSAGNNVAAIKAQLNQPMGVAVDCDTQRCAVYVADTGNNKIRRITSKDGAPGVIGNFAGSGKRTSTPEEIAAAKGKCSTVVCLGNNGSALKASFNEPRSVALDAYGNVLVADTGNNQIRTVGPGGMIMKYSLGLPDGDDTVDHTPQQPTDIMIDRSDNLIVAEAGTNQISRWNTFGVGDPGIVANASGTRGFSGDGSDSLAAAFNAPGGVAVTPWGSIVVADTGNNRVRELRVR